MSISELQNFYKSSLSKACTAGATNIYVSTKPTPTNGFLVISPGTESLREIIKYTGTGTDGDGDYVTVLADGDRGLGGTTDQTHEVGESIRMNYTAEHQKEIDDTISAIVSAGAPDSSTTVKGIVKLSSAPVSAIEPIAVGDNDTRLNETTGLTEDQEDALAGGGDFGTPSASNKFLTEEIFPTLLVTPQVVVFTSSGTWTKDAGLKYIVVEGVGGGGGADSDLDDEKGSGGGYFRKLILASALGATETVTVGGGGGRVSFGGAPNGGNTSFGAHATANGGTGGGAGGTATGGDINIQGQTGNRGSGGTGGNYSISGSSMLGIGGIGGSQPTGYGAGATEDYDGTAGIVIVTEYYT
jgi:hypothetical protein